MRAPTYPERDLVLNLYAYRYSGDIEELNLVGRLVGVHVPPPIAGAFFPLFTGGVVVLAVLAATSAFGRRPRLLAVRLPLVLIAGVLAWGQFTLYEWGHDLDPARPLRYLQEFTPPVIGMFDLGKIRTFHLPGIGSVLFFGAVTLLAARVWMEGRTSLPQRRSSGLAQVTQAR
jgi:hypothetical protein